MKYLYCLLCAVLAASILVAPAGAQNKTRVKSINVPSLNGEICLGDTLRPRVTVSNVSASAVNIRVLVKITNAVTNIDIYSAQTDLQNIAAGKDTVVSLAALGTNPNTLSQLGRHNVVAIASALVGGVVTPDSNPADDTLRTLLFGLRRSAIPFRESADDYSIIGSLAIPQQNLISLGATVVEGDAMTFDPPFPRDPGAGYGTLHLHSPVIKLDRRNINGVMYAGTASGDTLSSVPLNLEGQTKVALSFDYHRSGNQLYPWQYDKDRLRGAEASILNALATVTRPGDSLIIEFKKPAEPACEPSSNGWTQIAAIDGAKDFAFHRFYVKIESKNSPSINYFTKDFRFRLRLKAKADQSTWPNESAVDDEDAWYIDNIEVHSPRRSEYGIDWVRVITPYTKVPASQASFPVYLKINNKGASTQAMLPFIVQIIGPDGQTKYWQRQSARLPVGGTDTVIRFPNWDASNTMVTLGRECAVKAWCADPSWDALGWEEDNEAYSRFFLNVDNSSVVQEFAYDDAGIVSGLNAGNDFPLLYSQQGRGAGFNSMTGSYAMRFKLGTRDTIYGARVYFGRANAGNDAIRISVLDGSPQSATPGAVVNNDATMLVERKGAQFDQFWTYYFPKPIVLPGEANGDDGHYWLSVSQLALDNMQLGADLSRTGGDYRVQDPFTPVIQYVHRDPYATQYEATHNSGDISLAFAREITAGSGNWTQLTPGPTSNDVAFIPMIRPLVSRSSLLPVEFAKPLTASAQTNAALLTWTTATESSNSGFVVQRLAGEDDWQRVGFVRSRSINSNSPSGYTFVDEGLSAGTYTYRLTQVDLDGTESISNIAEVLIDGSDAHISNFTPNPFNPATDVATLSIDPSLGEVSVAIVNALGQRVRTITASGVIVWDGKDDAGEVVASGSYLVQLPNAEVRRITVVR